MPWSTIQAHLDGVEFMPSYVLNPLAPEFIPMAVHGSMSKLSHYSLSCMVWIPKGYKSEYVLNFQ